MMVDWSKPIEAVHADGRVVFVRYAGSIDGGEYLVSDTPADCAAYFLGDGTPAPSRIYASKKWRIRNVTTAPDVVSPEIVERMIRAIKRLSVVDTLTYLPGTPDSDTPLLSEARAIVAELTPVDGDLVEARKIAAKATAHHSPVLSAQISRGEGDDYQHTAIALAAIKRGRELEFGEWP